MMKQLVPFVFPGMPSRVVFAPGALSRTGDEIARLGRNRALVLSTPQQAGDAKTLARSLGERAAGTFSGAVMHTPVEVTEQALASFRSSGADCVVSFGGGSTIGLGKAIAVRTGADHVAIPTTYAGSEMTDILGETAGGEKTTRRDPAILPETVIYDVELTLGLPVAMSVTSGLNALAHAAEALYASDRNPITVLMAGEAVRALAQGLPGVVADPSGRDARSLAQYGAWLCGTCLGASSMALHHKLCHVLGGSFNLPHAETHAVMLPHTVGFNASAVPELMEPVASAVGATPGVGLHRFATRLGAPVRLADLGFGKDDIDRAADIAMKSPYANPRPFTRVDIVALLEDAVEGNTPPF
jgi:maleylacetate reductase